MGHREEVQVPTDYLNDRPANDNHHVADHDDDGASDYDYGPGDHYNHPARDHNNDSPHYHYHLYGDDDNEYPLYHDHGASFLYDIDRGIIHDHKLNRAFYVNIRTVGNGTPAHRG